MAAPFGVPLPEAGGSGGSEVKTLSLTLSTGNFKFVTLAAVDSKGVARSYYASGEPVYLKVTIRNDGAVDATAIIKITDVDTAAVVTSIGTGVCAPTASLTLDPPPKIGTMPNRNWNLKVEVTP